MIAAALPTRDAGKVWNYFQRIRRAELQYAVKLRKIAGFIGEIIAHFPIGDPRALPEINQALSRFAEIITPWARAAGARMVADVSNRDLKAWHAHSQEIGKSLKNEVQKTDIGAAARKIVDDQVHLITSLPTDAARRVQQYTMEYVQGGRRYDDLVELIQATSSVTKSRATLIARTETAKAQASITQARAQAIGADQYIWRTVMDSHVRPHHKKLEGTSHRWDDPPVAEANGARHAPGEYPNCFSGNMLVNLRFGCKRIWRGFHEGPLVTLKTGVEAIEVTPNHPILTPRGWVPAGQLDMGDEILAMSRERHGVRDYGIEERITTFDDLFEFARASGRSRVHKVRANFHGDLANRDVDEITLDPELSHDRDAAFLQQVGEFFFTDADGRVGRAGMGSAQEVGVTRLAGRMGEPVMFARTGVDAEGTQFQAKYVSSTADELGSLAQCDATPYQRRRVLDKLVRDFAGHVFTIETDTGYYGVGQNGVIALNCRCFAEPIIPRVIR